MTIQKKTQEYKKGDVVCIDSSATRYESAYKANKEWLEAQPGSTPVQTTFVKDDSLPTFEDDVNYIVTQTCEIYSRAGVRNQYCKLYTLSPKDTLANFIAWCHSSFLTKPKNHKKAKLDEKVS